MMDTINVFVYGTLKPGGTNYQQYCVPFLQDIRRAQVHGVVYDLPELGYPVMTTGNGWVRGYLFTLDETAMVGLDYLEGYVPNQYDSHHSNGDFEVDDFKEEYTRRWLNVFDLEKRPMAEAWVYLMNKPPEGAIWLPDGEWHYRIS